MISPAALQSVAQRIAKARSHAGRGNEPPIEIVAVTKAFPPQVILSAYEAGIKSIGENRVQEAEAKFKQIPPLPGMKRRLIGHLQSNKTRMAVRIFDAIDSLDSVKLARKVARCSEEEDKEMAALIQVNTGEDPAKFGFHAHETEEMLEVMAMEGLRVDGLMTIGTLTEDESEIRRTFRGLWKLKEDLNGQAPRERQLIHLSMGMSADYELAVEEGATMLRLGTVLFGPRPA
ncbi:MAG: YggS family pyridoxal phosphate-dependent enzyme [Candidatus Neomarinimicrobiota bacterium]